MDNRLKEDIKSLGLFHPDQPQARAINNIKKYIAKLEKEVGWLHDILNEINSVIGREGREYTSSLYEKMEKKMEKFFD